MSLQDEGIFWFGINFIGREGGARRKDARRVVAYTSWMGVAELLMVVL